MEKKAIIVQIAERLLQKKNCNVSGNALWEARCDNALEKLNRMLPHGSGLDGKVEILESSTPDKIKISADFHHMDVNGYYDGWTEHTIIVKPSFINTIDIGITGRNKNDIKEYLSQIFHYALTQEIEYVTGE